MLVDQAVGCDSIDQLDGNIKLFDAANAVRFGHAFSAQNSFSPQKDRDAGFDGILSCGENGPQTTTVRGLQSQPACPAARDAHVARDCGEHASCPDDLFTICAALRAI